MGQKSDKGRSYYRNRHEDLSFFFDCSRKCNREKGPPRHPEQRLQRLVEFSEEIITDWVQFVPSASKWVSKFATNAGRMKKNFRRGNQKCGFYDKDQLPHGGPAERKRRDLDDDVLKYDREDPSVGIKQITTGFRKWAERYLSNCSGQKDYQYQVNRMNKWNNTLQKKIKEHYGNKFE